jgi:hypothetical protein
MMAFEFWHFFILALFDFSGFGCRLGVLDQEVR